MDKEKMDKIINSQGPNPGLEMKKSGTVTKETSEINKGPKKKVDPTNVRHRAKAVEQPPPAGNNDIGKPKTTTIKSDLKPSVSKAEAMSLRKEGQKNKVLKGTTPPKGGPKPPDKTPPGRGR